MPVRKRRWVIVCLSCVSVCSEDHLCEIGVVVPRGYLRCRPTVSVVC